MRSLTRTPEISKAHRLRAASLAVRAGSDSRNDCNRRYQARMTEPLLSGLLAGWGVALPLGAIGVLIVDIGMRGGIRPAAAAAAGVATADFLYAAVAAAAGAAVAGVLEPHAHALRLGAAAVLAVVALLGLRSLRRAPPGTDVPLPPTRGLYLRFVALTSVNPLTVAYFAALIAGLPAIASAAPAQKLVFVAAAGIASLSWQLVLAGVGATLRRRLPASARLYTALAGNALVLGLAVHMAVAT
jgi:threonine/homoserine/homoserine lactone efflux protein